MRERELPEDLADAFGVLSSMAFALHSLDPELHQIVVPAATHTDERSRVGEATEGVVVIDDAGRITGMNDAAQRIFGVAQAEAIDQDVGLLLGDQTGESAVRITRRGQGHAKTLSIAPGVHGRRKDGQKIALEIKTTALVVDGVPSFCVIVHDLGERRKLEEPARKAEARYRALVEQIPAVTFMAALDEGGNEMYVSPQIESLLGFSQAEWLSDPILWFKQLHPDDQAIWNAEFARGIAAGGPFRAECRVFTRDRRLVWLHGEARLVRDDRGRPLFLQGIAFDITESKRALEQIRDAQAAKIRNERLAAVGQLAASIGHDIRNPLGAVMNAFYFVTKKVKASPLHDDPRMQKFLDIIQKELKAATGIVSDLLDFARERAPSLVACPIGPLVDDAFSIIPTPAHVRLVNDVPDSFPIPDLDKDQFRQVIVNLVQNAAEAIPAGRDGWVRVAGAATDSELTLSVSDNGSGIPAEIVDKVFEPLFTSKVKGTGLGLSIVSNTIVRHGGTIQVETSSDKGTTFHVRLPRARPPAAAAGGPVTRP